MHDAACAQRWILTMIDHSKAEAPCVFHGPSHHSRVGNWSTVIRDGYDPCVFHLSHLSKFFAATTFSYRSDGKDVCEPGCLTLLNNKTCNRGIVIDRIRIGHGADARPAAGNCSRRTGRYRFLVFLAGLTQMHVEVDEPRCNDQT